MNWKRSYYNRFRRNGWKALSAWRAAGIVDRFEDEETAGRVRLDAEPDWETDPLDTDVFDPRCNPGIGPARLERQKREYLETLERIGVWVVLGQIRREPCSRCGKGGDWETVISCSGMTYGNPVDPFTCEIAVDLMNETVAALDAPPELVAAGRRLSGL